MRQRRGPALQYLPTGSHRRSQSEFSAFLSYVQYTPLCAYLITDKEPETSRKFDKKPHEFKNLFNSPEASQSFAPAGEYARHR
jgi:hypothetical protein